MKMDKDSLLKNHFWLLLALAGALLVGSIGLLFVGPAAKARAERTKYEAMEILSPDSKGIPPDKAYFGDTVPDATRLDYKGDLYAKQLKVSIQTFLAPRGGEPNFPIAFDGSRIVPMQRWRADVTPTNEE